METIRLIDESCQQTLCNFFTHTFFFNFQKSFGQNFASRGSFDVHHVDLAKLIIFRVLINVNHRHFIKNIWVFFINLANGIFVWTAHGNHQVIFEFGWNERKVSRVNGTFFRGDKNPQLIFHSLRFDVGDFVEFGVESQHKVSSPGQTLNDFLRFVQKSKTLQGWIILGNYHGCLNVFLFEKKIACPSSPNCIPTRILRREDQHVFGALDDIFELLLGIKDHI